MGQHKHNKTAVAAKNGELTPKPPRIGKREAERRLRAHVIDHLFKEGLTIGCKQTSEHSTVQKPLGD